MSESIIAGAGPVGCLQSIILRKTGHPVSIYEKRSDPRKQNRSGGRSINLVVTSRGIASLQEAGLWSKVKEICVPVSGRVIHSITGESVYQPYGKDSSECNYSVSRGELNNLLIDEAEKAEVEIFFEREVEDYDLKEIKIKKRNGIFLTIPCRRLFGADGVNSPTRKALVQHIPQSTESIIPLTSGYKEFLMPPNALDKHALHIWPRGSHMLMALPNLDGSFTMTLYLPLKGTPISFEHITNQQKVRSFFHQYYADIIPLVPFLEKDFFSRPLGKLGTVKCQPWFYRDKIVLIGDAAHAIVPFFGQGMNCGFEDCYYLSKFFKEEKGDWEKTFIRYNNFQRPNGDAIAEMALENFIEMRDKVGNKNFLLRKSVDLHLEKLFPHLYRTRYAMVVYTLIPYRLAQKVGEIQQEILDELCQNITAPEQINTRQAEILIRKKLLPFLTAHNLTF